MSILLAADWDTLIKIGVFLVVIGYSVINQIITAARKARQNLNRPPEPRPLQPKAPPAEKLVPQQQQLHDEVEEFLRRAGQRKGSPAPPPLPPAKRPRVNVELPPKPKPSAPARTVSKKAAKSGGRGTSTKDVDEAVAKRLGPSHLDDQITSRHLETHVGSLTPHEEAFDTQISNDFNRSVGTLVPQTSADGGPPAAASSSTSNPPSPAEAIAAAMRNPASVREAIILSELFARPEHRW